MPSSIFRFLKSPPIPKSDQVVKLSYTVKEKRCGTPECLRAPKALNKCVRHSFGQTLSRVNILAVSFLYRPLDMSEPFLTDSLHETWEGWV